MTTIDCFQETDGTHLPLSNFWRSRLDIDTFMFQSVEHYYQAMKAAEVKDFDYIRQLPSPGGAKRAGRSIELRRDWEEIKLLVMRKALVEKFRLNTYEGDYLLNTGTALLIEGNTWGDQFWGQVRGRGWNWLGILLMARRAELVSQL